jgi:hypothetical protein
MKSESGFTLLTTHYSLFIKFFFSRWLLFFVFS